MNLLIHYDILVTCIFLSVVFCTKTNFAFSCFIFVLFFVSVLMLGSEGGYFCFENKQGLNSKAES